MNTQALSANPPKLGEIGLANFPPYLMNRIIGRYNASLREQLAALGLSTPQARALAVLSVNDGLLIRDLAVFAVVQQSTLSRALDALAREGLIRRETDPADGRGVKVFITEAGRKTFEDLWPHMAMETGRLFRGISDEERRALVATLQKMLANIRKHDL